MKIEVLFFAQLKEAYGSGHMSLELPSEAKVSDAVHKVMGEVALHGWSGLPLRYAINEEFISADTTLRPNDRLALLSPVAGG